MRKILGILALLIVICVVTTIWNVRFVLATNIENDIRRSALFAFIGIGAAFVIVTGGIDLSIGSLIALTGVLLAMFLQVRYEVDETAQANIVAVDLDGKTLQLSRPLGLSAGEQVVFDAPGREDPDKRSKRSLTVVSETGAGLGATLVVRERPTSAQGVDSVHPAYRRHMSVPLAVALVLLISAGIGLLHGLLVTKVKLQPFVVTLCGLMVYRGLARVLANDRVLGFGTEYKGLKYLAKGQPLHVPVPFLKWISQGDWSRWKHNIDTGEAVFDSAGEAIPVDWIEWIGIPMPLLMLVLVAGAAILFLNYSIYGRYLLALGRNEQAARYSGINTDRMVIVAYVICSLLAGFTGILFALDLNSVQPSSHGNLYELYAIAAAVLGGCSLRGGEASVIGAVIGAAVMQVLYNMINLTPIPNQSEFIVIGVVILAGVASDEVARQLAAQRKARLEAAQAEQ